MRGRYIVKKFGPRRNNDRIRFYRRRRHSLLRNYNRFNNKRFIRIRNRYLNRKKRKNINKEDLDKELDKYQEKVEIEKKDKENENNDNIKEENKENQMKVDNS